jgi:alpha-glucosidase (family GH31 glycosyl hydrolase)
MKGKMKIFFFCLLTVCICAPAYSQVKTGGENFAVADTNLVLPPSWAFGILYGGYTNQQETIDRVKKIKNHDYPIDAYWIDSWFWSYADKGRGPKKFIDFIADTTSYPNRKAMWRFLQQNDIKGGFWIWDCIEKTCNETAFNEFKDKGYFSKIFINKDSWHNNSTSTAMFEKGNKKAGTPAGNIDFDNPKAVAFFKQKMKHFFDEGADFIKLDRTDNINTCKAMFEMIQKFGKETKGRGFMLSHSGGTENEAYERYPGKWTDDTRSDWTVEKPTVEFNPWVPHVAFKENIAMYTDPKKSTSKIPFLTNDMGGFDMGKTDKPDEELYIRWLQFSMFCPITEVFSQPENPTSNLAWKYSARADSIFRFYSHLRMQLFPYIYSTAELRRIKGEPIIGEIPNHLYEFTLGPGLLVAPVYEQGATSRKVFFPEGKWVDYWTGKTVKGNSENLVAARLDRVPLFVKQGSIIPMRAYASSIEKGDNNTLMLQVYPGADGAFDLVEDDGTSNDYLNGKVASTLIELKNKPNGFSVIIRPVTGNYNGMNQDRKWILNIHFMKSPKSIRLNNKEARFTYNRKEHTASVETTSRSVHQITAFEVSYN